MTDGVKFSLTGIDELLGKLEGVAHDVKYKGGRFALRKAANLVANAAKSNAQRIDDPQSAQDISKNVAVRWSSRTFKRSGNLAFRVGVMGGAGGNLSHKDQSSGLPGGDTRHWRLVEFGTEKARAQPFMRPALEQNINAATDEFIKQYDKALDRAIKKAAKVKA